MNRVGLRIEHYDEKFVKNKYDKIDKFKDTIKYTRDLITIGQPINYSLNDEKDLDNECFRVIDADKDWVKLELLHTPNGVK